MISTHFNSVFPMIAPPTGVVGVGLTILQVLITLVSYREERTKPTQYSKFASVKEDQLQNPIPSKLGMLIIYSPATVVGSLFAFNGFFPSSPVASLVFLHFLKRTMETLFLHKYSGQMERDSAVMIGMVYTFYTILISSYALPSEAVNDLWKNVGYGIFVIGTLGNLYHHYLLASLRKGTSVEEGQKRYQAPIGGLFSHVAAPHYLCELIAWFGIAFVAQQANAFLVLSAMSSYLLARAKNTNEYYFEKFDEEEWPRSQKALIPLVV